MTPQSSQILESYVPVYDTVPEKWEDAREFLIEQLRKISNGVNNKTIGFYLDTEQLSGNQYFPGVATQGNSSPQQNRQVLRMVVDFGALPNSMTKSVPHNIFVDPNFTLVRLYGAATDPIGLSSFPIPYADNVSLGNAVPITLSPTKVNITTGANRSNYTRCLVVIEYLQEL